MRPNSVFGRDVRGGNLVEWGGTNVVGFGEAANTEIAVNRGDEHCLFDALAWWPVDHAWDVFVASGEEVFVGDDEGNPSICWISKRVSRFFSFCSSITDCFICTKFAEAICTYQSLGGHYPTSTWTRSSKLPRMSLLFTHIFFPSILYTDSSASKNNNYPIPTRATHASSPCATSLQCHRASGSSTSHSPSHLKSAYHFVINDMMSPWNNPGFGWIMRVLSILEHGQTIVFGFQHIIW